MSEDVSKVSQRLLEHGVTAYCPTIVTSSPDYYKRTLPKIKPTLGGKHGAAVLGKSLLCLVHHIVKRACCQYLLEWLCTLGILLITCNDLSNKA